MTSKTEETITIQPEMSTPDVTPMQVGAGSLFGVVAAGCLSGGVTGTDLLAYLITSAVVTTGLVIGDAVIRAGRARGAGAINNYRG